jgi:hypothetical protein
MSVTLNERPVFVIGSERSGTTLVMAILGCHPRIAVPEVTWYYPRFRPYLHTYGDLSDSNNFRILAFEMAHGLRMPYWRMDVEPNLFANNIADRALEIEQSYAGIFAAMFEGYSKYENKPRWGEKTPYNIFFLDQILEDFPNAQFVYIYRDGRDASAEFLDSAFGPTNIYSAARIWKDGQEAALTFRKKLTDDQWFNIKYEELVLEPVDHLQRLCTFLGEEYTSDLMAFHTTPTAKRRGATKDNWALAHPITDRHVGLYQEQLSLRDQKIMSWVAGDMLRELDYGNVLVPLILSAEEIELAIEMDGRYRAAELDSPGGWIVFESYNDGLVDTRNARRDAGIWSAHPDPVPFPIGHEYEEYYSGLRAVRKWKDHFSIKRDKSGSKAVL